MAQLVKKIKYTGVIEALSGIHIGSSNSQLAIGGVDNYVVRNPVNNMPYIPGSSLKGKMRSLIELSDNTIGENGAPSSNLDSAAVKLFGSADSKKARASRLIVRDANLINAKELENCTELPYTESKTEVSIDRLTGTASKAGPRTFERVPAGAKFQFNLVLNIFEGEDETLLRSTVERALHLLEDDYIGGSGSRGYGHVKISYQQPVEKLTKNY